MKIIKLEDKFQPVTVVFESQAEIDYIYKLIGSTSVAEDERSVGDLDTLSIYYKFGTIATLND